VRRSGNVREHGGMAGSLQETSQSRLDAPSLDSFRVADESGTPPFVDTSA
jgi:hypothetical protein